MVWLSSLSLQWLESALLFAFVFAFANAAVVEIIEAMIIIEKAMIQELFNHMEIDQQVLVSSIAIQPLQDQLVLLPNFSQVNQDMGKVTLNLVSQIHQLIRDMEVLQQWLQLWDMEVNQHKQDTHQCNLLQLMVNQDMVFNLQLMGSNQWLNQVMDNLHQVTTQAILNNTKVEASI